MVGGFLRRGHSLDRLLSRRRRAVSPSPSFSSPSSSPSSPRGSISSVRSSGIMADDEDDASAAAATAPLQKRMLSRSHGSRAISGRLQDLPPPVPPRTVRDRETGPPSDLDLVNDKFAKLLLGEDMSGTGKGVSSALALSNAITNLAASIFGEQRRLEPMSAERRTRWNKEIDWLLSVTDHIVECAPSQQVSEDGTNMEVMGTQQRMDLLVNIPALRKLDAMLLEYLDSFNEAQEYWYVAKDADGGEDEESCDKWWIPTVRVPDEGLSEASKKWLQHQKDLVGQVLKAAMAINADVLTEMEIPEEYIESLPKNGRSILGDSMYKTITDDIFNPNELLNSADLSTEHKIVDLKDRIEASVVIWQRKLCNKLSWGPASYSSQKREEFEERAQTVLLILKQRFPGIPQSSLDISKIQYNKDVGFAILESYSRTLESLAFAVLSRIEDVLHADAVVRDPKRTKSRRRPSVESPVHGDAHHGSVHWQDQDAEDDDEKHLDANGGKLKKIHRIATKKLSHMQKIDTMAGGLRSFTHR
ncbi:hypothetical protein U9M48_018115 [Paspalum notatum var. saurae]|uniref:PRONE domain-containing protein n=1 Tax=Paspalum notatum var. saurae TaxID=547442 RepID=A0AAQ3TCH7_PASNO